MFLAQQEFLGQTKVALLDDKKQPFAFYILRHTDINAGDIYQGRICQKMDKLKAYFVDIGKGQTIFFPSSLEYPEGQILTFEIKQEERPGKTASAGLAETQRDCPVGLVQKAVFPHPQAQNIPWDEDIEEALQESLLPIRSFADGARLIIERTAAFWSIDVDSHSSLKTLEEINVDAAPIIAREIIKRNLSGNIIIDFIGKKKRKDLNQLMDLLHEGLNQSDVPFQMMGVSPLGNVEIRRERKRAALFDLLSSPKATAYAFFEDILKSPSHLFNAEISLELSYLLQKDLHDEWSQLERKVGKKIPLKTNPTLKTYMINQEKKNG